MPRVKIDYVVSFSSEDPEHPANNLLLREVSKKKWLCNKGESSCSVVLQLARAVKITGVHIGAYHAALVEVLVGRSETSSEDFQVLVPRSVFVSREESRRGAAVTRVRSFGTDALSAPARDQRWDRLRIVCQQPYDKHSQFGLSFVHVDEAEGSGPGAAPPRVLPLATYSDDEDDFKPGELFAKHLQNSAGDSQPTTNTSSQIRQATSQALKNISDLSTKLTKTPISKPAARRSPSPPSSRAAPRSRHELLYCRADDAPHARIDALLQRHAQEKEQHDTSKPELTRKPNETTQKLKDEPKVTPVRNNRDSPPRPQKHDKARSEQNKDKMVRKRRRSDNQEESDMEAAGPVSAAPHTLLRGATLVLSGYQNPRRAHVRTLALALGARVLPDWGPACTHLICAFPNTPKLRAVRAGERAGGRAVPAARAEWLEQCSRRRRLLPWRWFATEDEHRLQPRPDDLLDDDDAQPDTHQTKQNSDSENDTDDEIEKVLQKQKKRPRRLTESKTDNDDTPIATTSVATSPGGSRPSSDTDEEVAAPTRPEPARGGALPNFFDGYTFCIDASPSQARLMTRYVRAYGGEVLQMSEVSEGSAVDYIVAGRGAVGPAGGGATRVTAGWLARCHAAGDRLPH